MGCNLSASKSEGWNEVKVKRTNNRTKVLPLNSVKQTKLQKWAEAKAKRNQDSSLFPGPEHVAVGQWRTQHVHRLIEAAAISQSCKALQCDGCAHPAVGYIPRYRKLTVIHEVEN